MTPLQGTSRAITRGITPAQFLSAFTSSWQPILGPGALRPRIGLAVSGGVDSMALVQLCHMVNWVGEYRCSPILHAFVVDHKIREGSGAEALLTARRIEQLRIKTTILPLQWPEGMDPRRLPNLETEARKLRYQLLGKACSKRNIRRLLLAHHSDDQAETVFMQMLTPGRSRLSIRGMPSKGNIPECWGIHGAHESGLDKCVRASIRDAVRHKKALVTPLGPASQTTLGIEDGGVIISRPLLGFSKAELRQTCIENRMEWIEDDTNQDPTLTKRNAVRMLVGSVQLPAALSKDSLLGLRKTFSNKATSVESRAAAVFKKFKMIRFDARCGGLVVRLKAHMMQHHARLQYNSEQTRWEAMERALEAIRSLLSIVTPLETIDKQKLGVAARSLFPDTLRPGEDQGKQATKFTIAGVLCERIASPASVDDVKVPEYLDQDHVWTFNRQPFSNRKPRPTTQFPPIDSGLIESLPNGIDAQTMISEPEPMTVGEARWSPFRLWDGRFWIRMRNRTPHTLSIQAFRPAHMQYLRINLPRHQFKVLQAILAVAAPGNVRWTLPVVVIPASCTTGDPVLPSSTPTNSIKQSSQPQDTPICLPTLGSTFNSPMYCDTETRFRKVDFGLQVPAQRPGNFTTADLDFVITRTGPETAKEQEARKQRELYRAKRHAMNKASKRLRKEEKAERKRCEPFPAEVAANAPSTSRQQYHKQHQQHLLHQPVGTPFAHNDDTMTTTPTAPRHPYSPSTPLREAVVSTDAPSALGADTRLYQEFSFSSSTSSTSSPTTTNAHQAREISHEKQTDAEYLDEYDDDEYDGVFPRQRLARDGRRWAAYIPLRERQEQIAPGGRSSKKDGEGEREVVRQRRLRGKRTNEELVLGGKEDEGAEAEKWKSEEHWREWI